MARPAWSQSPRTPSGPTDAQAQELLRKAAEEAIKLDSSIAGHNAAIEVGLAQIAAGDREGAKATLVASIKILNAEAVLDHAAMLQATLGLIECGHPEETHLPVRAAISVVMKEWDAHEDRVQEARGRVSVLQLLRAQVKAGDKEGRDATLALIEKRTEGAHPLKSTPRTETYDFYSRMQAWTACGQEELALREVGRFSFGADANPDVGISILTIMAEAMRCRPANEARPILERMRGLADALELKPEATAQTRYFIAQSMALAGDTRQAEVMARTIDSVGQTHYQVAALTAIGIARGEQGDIAGAREDLRAAFKIAEGHINDGGNSNWIRIAEAQARIGDGAGVKATLLRVEPEFWTQILIELATSERGRGDEQSAMKSLSEAEKAIRLVLGKVIDSTSDRDLAAATDRAGLEMKNPARFGRDLALLARTRIAAGDVDSARIAIEAISHTPQYKSREFGFAMAQHDMAMGRTLHGDLDGAITEALALPIPMERQWAISGAAIGYGHWKRAQKLK